MSVPDSEINPPDPGPEELRCVECREEYHVNDLVDGICPKCQPCGECGGEGCDECIEEAPIMKTNLTSDELKAIRERCEAASDGPWFLDSTDYGYLTIENGPHPSLPAEIYYKEKEAQAESEKLIIIIETGEWKSGTIEFIAHARTDIPALLDEVERLRHGILRLKDTLRSIDGHAKGIRTYAGAIDEAISNVCMEVTTNDN